MLYLHIPFCKQACSYCNFHFSTNLKNRKAVIDAICRELAVRRKELPAGPVRSIYFGGGTPSLLTEEELSKIFGVLRRWEYLGGAAGAAGPDASGVKVPEITLEANPDDLDPATISMLAASPVNRLSIGIQSFSEVDLRFMNRAHSAEEAMTAVEKVRSAGFEAVSIDLIFGGQTTTDEIWRKNLAITTDLGVDHVSTYALTVEPKTALSHRVASGAVAPTNDERFERQFYMLVEHLLSAGYEQYEISSFGYGGVRSRHNSGYWSGRAYLGVGPGAHSFDGVSVRRWNVSNNQRYARVWKDIDSHARFMAAKELVFDEERLTPTDRYNEYLMTGLRTQEGVSIDRLITDFGKEAASYFKKSMQPHLEAGCMLEGDDGNYRLSLRGMTLADAIAAAGFR